MKKIKDVDQKRIETEQQRDVLKADIARLEREMEAQRRQIELDKKNIEDMAREKDLVCASVYSVTHFTCFTGTKVQMLMQRSRCWI
jgi:septal ring factor EnvC (AmiA/AmiB activator)